MSGIALEDVIDLSFAHVEQFSQLLGGRFTLMLLLEGHVCLICLVVSANLVLRETNETTLFSQSLEDGLTDPPNSVRDEFEAFGFIETLCRLDQTKVTLVDQITQRKPLVLVLFGY